MNRTQLINSLLRKRGGRSYLEIGCLDRNVHFDKIECQYKIGVGRVPGIAFQGEADDYFDRHQEAFDLIFIDGDHTEEQVLRDIRNALVCLAPGGIIVLHDCMPPTEWHQRPKAAVKERELWNGTVWKAALRTFNESRYRCTLLDTDWGCGIIDTSERHVPPGLALPDELDYHRHYELLLLYRQSVAAFMQREVNVFYHLACMGNWQTVLHEQTQQLGKAGFQELALSVLGTAEEQRTAERMLQDGGLQPRLIFGDPELSNFERPTIMAIEHYARSHEGYVLYLHSKGVSAPQDDTKAKWRRLMMQELVVKSEQCIARLPEYDAIGVNWREMPPISHFCGNFWYASTGYLRKLPAFDHYYDNPRYRVPDGINARRLGCEFWIGSARERPKILSLAYRNEDFCNAAFWRNKNV